MSFRAKTWADIFRENGLTLLKGNRNRETVWLAVKELLTVKNGESRLKIFKSCTELIECVPALQRDLKRPTDCMTEPHEITHLPDALRYFCLQYVVLLAGALSGGAMTAANSVANRAYVSDYGKRISKTAADVNQNAAELVINEGKASPKKSEAYKNAVKLEEKYSKNKKLSNYNIGLQAIYNEQAHVSVGEKFRDTKTGNTIEIVDRNDTETVVDIITENKTERRTYKNENADTLKTSGQYVPIFAGSDGTADYEGTAEETATTVPDKVLKSTRAKTVNVGDYFVDKSTSNIIKVTAQNGDVDTVEITTPSGASEVRQVPGTAVEKLAESVDYTNVDGNTEPKNITLTRMGDFYETFGDEALELAEKLNLTPTYKTVNGVKTAMVGFPVHVLEKYQGALGNGYNLIVSDTTNMAEAVQNNTVTESLQASNESIYAEENAIENGDLPVKQLIDDYDKTVDGIVSVTGETAKALADKRTAVKVLENTPSVILDNVENARDLKVIINYKKLYLAVRESGVFKGHYHNLGTEIAKQLPSFLQNPDAVVQLANGRLNLFSTVKTERGNNGIISVELNSTKDIDGKNVDYNVIVTMFSSDDNYARNLISSDGVAVKYKNEDLSQVNPQLYKWLATINDKSSVDNIVSQNNNVVNNNIRKNPENISSEPEAEPKNMYEIMNNFGLTYDEQRAILEYKSSGSYTLNEKLRKGETLSSEELSLKETVNSALDKFPVYSKTVYRNIGFFGNNAKENFGNFIAEHNGKSVIKYPYFLSTSKTEDGYAFKTDFNVHYEIESKNARDVEQIGLTEEREVLFKTDTAYAVDEFTVDGNNINIKMREIDSNATDNRTYEVTGDGHNVANGSADIENQRMDSEVYSTNDSVRGRSTTNAEVYSEQSASDGQGSGNGSIENSGRNEIENRNAPVSEGVVVRVNSDTHLTDKCDLIATKHTATGDDIWVVTLKEIISQNDFNELRQKVKAVGGYYSKFSKTPDGEPIPGFVFKSEPTEKELKAFNDFFGEAKTDTSVRSENSDDGKRLYDVYRRMKDRCYNSEAKDFKYYGGKGVKLAAEWFNDFDVFLDWALKSGYKEGLTIDRIDPDGNYEPSNCRWVTMAEQNRNKSVDKNNSATHDNTDVASTAPEAKNAPAKTKNGIKEIDVDALFGAVGNAKVGDEIKMSDYETQTSDEHSLKKEPKSDVIEENTGKDGAENVHNGILGGSSEDDVGVRKSGAVSEAETDGNVGKQSREPGGNVAEESGQAVRVLQEDETAEEPDTDGIVDDGVRKSDERAGHGSTGVVGDDNVNVKKNKAKDFAVTKSVAENTDNTAPNMPDNLKAIETLYELERTGKAPTTAQQLALAKFKGWGGLSNAFYGENLAKLRTFMSESEIKAAQSTVNDAYFTPTGIIDGVYKALEQLGFEGGNILEPSMGIGNFFGRMPKSIKQSSSLFGVEIDTVSGRIAQKLYPSASVEVAPFQDVAYRDGAFDLVVGNVPFGEVKYRYKGKKYLIHDYFFVKAADKLNDGGVAALLTSKGTLDKLDGTVRAELANKCNLIAAYRLPSDVFTKNAGANVVTDLIILQKSTVKNGEKFLNLGSVSVGDDKFSINEYFVNHPENIIGKLAVRKDWRSGQAVLDVVSDGNTTDKLAKAVKKLPKNLLNGVATVGNANVTENAANAQSFAVNADGKVEYVDIATGEVKQISGKNAKTAKGYIELKNAYNELTEAALGDYAPEYAEEKRKSLNTVYGKFTEQFGTIAKNKKVLSADRDFYKISGLEVYDTKTKKYLKSEIFEKDTMRRRSVKKADNVLDALSISMGETGGVDMNRIATLTGISEKEAAAQLEDRIVYTPDGNYELNEVYLSGNVREKYNAVKGKKGFEKNEQLLKSVIPEDIPASNITPQFGASWIKPGYVADFLAETLHMYQKPTVMYAPATGTWSISGNGWGDHTLMTSKYGTKYLDALKLAEKALNMRTIVVRDRYGKTIVGETRVAQQKAEDIKAAFEEWCFKDRERREDLVKTFNEKFNSNRNMDFSELSKHLAFDGLTDGFELRDYQKRAVARAVFNGNTLFAHGVGTGKTAEMIATAMELKRMGMAKKNMMVVPNHKAADFRNDILKMYPSAKVAYLEKGANTAERQRFYATVAANDFDIAIIPHSAFGMLDVSVDTKKAFIRSQIAELEETLTAAQEEKGKIDGRFIRSLEVQKKTLEGKLKFVTETAKDNGNTFEELGVDSLFVDEAHNFKNLPFYSKLSRLAGVSTNQSNNKARASRAENMFMMTDYLNRNGGRIVFGTATPITNSMSEIYNMIKFLRPDILEEAGLKSFDAWAGMFGSVVSAAEVDPTGRSMRMKERFSKFKNVSQMVEQFRRVADILKTGDVIQELPEVERIDVESESNKYQEEFLDIIDEIVSDIQSGGQRSGRNMLEVTTAGKMAALDLRLVKSYFDGKYTADELNLPNNRSSRVAQKVYEEYKNSNKTKGTQFVFCDYGVYDKPDAKYGFHVYGDLINKLVALGIPRSEIAVAQEFEDKADLSAKMNTGEIRVLIGSTQVMGEGMNAQNKAVALHHMTVPDRPSDIEQREGRIVRYGNENKNVRIYRYIQRRSYDSYQWQMQERKAGFINQALSGGAVDELEEMSDFQLSAREAKAVASGNPLLLKKIEVEDKLDKLKSLRRKFNTDKAEMQSRLAVLPTGISKLERSIAETSADRKTVSQYKEFEITLGKTKYTERAKAAKALEKGLANAPRNGASVKIGSYRGLELYYSSSFETGTYFTLKGSGEYSVPGGAGYAGSITRIANAAEQIGKDIDGKKAIAENYKAEIDTLKREVAAEFPQTKELEELQAELNDIDTKLGVNVDTADMSDVVVDDESEEAQYSLTEDVFEAKSEDIEKLSSQIDKWLKGEMRSDEQFRLGQTPTVLKTLGASDLPIVMNRNVMAKVTGLKHDISVDEIKKIPQAIADPIMVFKSATVDNAFVILTELTDKQGNDVVVAMHLNRKDGFNTINRISSVYGKENIGGFVEKQIGNDNLKYVEKNKSREWLRSRGLQLPKLNTVLNSNNSILQKEDIVNSYFTQNNEKYSSESEDFTNGRNGILSGNGGRTIDESTGGQAERISSYKQTLKGKSSAERKSTAKELTLKGYAEEVTSGNHKYTLIKEDGYNDDMRSIVSEAKAYGKEVGFFIGNAVRKFDSRRNYKIDGIKLSDNKILIRYDGVHSPQALLMHELVHTERDNPEMQRAKEEIFSDLSESEKLEILQDGRYRDYMELYNGDEEAVWEEFVADVFAGMNDYSEVYVDTAVDYWYSNDTSTGYNPSDYAKIADAGGEYSLTDDIPYNEKRQLDEYIMRKNNSGDKLKKVDFKEIGNNFYVWENNSKTDYDVIDMIEIDGNEDLIDIMKGEMKDGSIGTRKSVRKIIAQYNGGPGSGYTGGINDTRRRKTSGNGSVAGGVRADNGRGNIAQSGGNTQADRQTKYSLTGDDGNDGFSDEWREKIDTYGAIPKGANYVRDVDVPKKISEKDVVSRFARTMIEAGVTPDETVSEFERAVLDGKMSHEVITNKKAGERAKEQIEYLGFKEALNRWTVLSETGKVGKNEIVLGMELYNQCITNKDVHNAMKIAAELTAEATRAGQTLQACNMLKLMSPDGQLYYIEKSIQKMNDEFKARLGDKFKNIEVDEKLMEEFFNATDEEGRNAAYDKICQNIADQIPTTYLDKWNSWRYLAMLGNPRTHIRNITGNAVFVPAVRIKNYVGAAIEKAARIAPEERTHSARKSKEAIEFAKKDFAKTEKILQGENAKYAVTSDVGSRRTIFKTTLLEKLRQKNFDFLEKEDMWFLKMHYVDALARLITVRNIDVNSMSAQTLNQLRAYAIKEAQAATYRDANSLAEGLNRLQRRAEMSDSKAVRATGVLIEGVMPFKKTPMNIAKQGVNYSPVGILKGTYELVSKVRGGDIQTSQIVDSFAKGLTGTGAMLLGLFLSSLGMLVGEDEKSTREKAFDQMTGEQSYALKIGNASYTIDWMTPSNLSLFVGAKLYDLTKDEFKLSDTVDALSSLAEPLLELSVFSSVNDLIETAQYSGGEKAIALTSNMASSYLMQALPTLFGQVNRITNGKKREYYYIDKNRNIPKELQRLIGQASSKIPFVSFLFEPSVDEWGREETYGNIFERVFENTVSPGYYSVENYTAIDRELKRLYESTGENSVLPATQQKYYTEKGERYNMTAKDYNEVKKIRGERSFELVKKFIASAKYKGMTDEEKVNAVKKCYEQAGKEAKAKMLEKVKKHANA